MDTRTSGYMPQEENKHNDRESSDVHEEEGLLRGDEDDKLEHDQHRFTLRRKKVPLMKRVKVGTLFTALFLIAGVFVWAYVLLLLSNFHCDTRPVGDNFEPDLVYSSRVTFQPHLYYGGPPSEATNEMWRRLEPPGDGIVSIPRKYATNLHPSLQDANDPDSVIYGISMFHQLHCLNFLRLAYWPETVANMSTLEVGIHRDHCLDYIRQAIMCHGDATFETINNQGVLDGMGGTHVCRDFDLMFSWAYEHRANKENGSGYKPEKVLTHTPAKQNDFSSK